MGLEKITIGIKSFMRETHLHCALDGIEANLLECRLIVVDDGQSPTLTPTTIHIGDSAFIVMPFDSGFGAKSNAIADALQTPYLLIGSDDFDFKPKEVRVGIQRLLAILENHPEIDIAAGRVNNRPYEFDLVDDIAAGSVFEKIVPEKEVYTDPLGYQPCDLTVNYYLARKSVFDKVRWHDDVKIGGGEHGAFFVQAKRAGIKTVYVPGVNICEQDRSSSAEYMSYRNRARSKERPAFDKIGVKMYVLGNGQIDYYKD